jgi:hypothetical protein
MHPNAILHEVQQLYDVSDRLDSLAEQHSRLNTQILCSNLDEGIGVQGL